MFFCRILVWMMMTLHRRRGKRALPSRAWLIYLAHLTMSEKDSEPSVGRLRQCAYMSCFLNGCVCIVLCDSMALHL